MRIVLTLLTIYFLTTYCYADTNKNVEYHCPPANHVDAHRHEYASYTDYNGIEIDWFSTIWAPDHVQVIKFNAARIYRDDEIRCVYDVSNGDSIILEPRSYDTNYRYKYNSSNGKWNNGSCESSQPENCLFYIQIGN